MSPEFNLFSEVEIKAEKKSRVGNLADNKVQIMCNLKTRNYYVRLNRPLADLIDEKGFTAAAPVFNNLTGELYLVFSADEKSGFPVTTNGGNCRNYIFSRQLLEWILTNAHRKFEDVSEVWTISGDLSINPARVVVRIENK